MLINHDLVISNLEKDHLDLAFQSSGFDQCKKNQIYGPRVRRYHLIHFVLSGKGTLSIGSRKYSIHSNQAFYIPAGVSATYQADFHTPWEYYWIGVCGTNAIDYCRLLFGSSHVMDLKNASQYAEAIINMLACTDQRIQPAPYFIGSDYPASLFSDALTLPQHLFLNGMTKQIFSNLLLEEEHDFKYTKNTDYAFQIKDYLEKHYHEQLLIGDIAQDLGLNPHYASELFKKKFGRTPKQYLTELRIEKAKILLSDTEYTLTVIANAVGLENPFSFSRLFKSVTGVSPNQYRKQ